MYFKVGLAIIIATILSGCVATNQNGETGIKGVYTGHIYTKDDLLRYKEIFNDGKHIVLKVKEEVETVKSDSEKTE